MRWVFWLYLVNTAFMLAVAIREARRPAVALNCITVGLVLPVVGFVFYLLALNPLRIHREKLLSPHNDSERLPDAFSRSALAISHSLRQFTVHGLQTSRVQVLTNGSETFTTLIASLRKAKRTIDLEYYLFRHDHIGQFMTDVLIERANAGVQIRFMRDGWASRKFPRNQILRMLDAGIECRTIFPPRFSWILSTLNYRDHCKIAVIDGKEAFTGGLNVGDEYLGLNPKIGFWRDTHLWLVGEVTADLQAIFERHWKIASSEKKLKKPDTVHKPMADVNQEQRRQSPLLREPTPAQWSTEWAAELGIHDVGIPSLESLTQVYLQTIEGNPEIPTQIIREAYFVCITQATKTLHITTPYFVPDVDIIMAIKTAVLRGVRVRLLVPNRTFPGVVGPASRTYFGELLEAGVEVYLYNKGMLHAKIMTIDDEISLVGAANYDMRSFRLDYEVCEVIYSADIARELTIQFEQDLKDSITLQLEDIEQRSIPQRLMEQGARLLSPLL